MSQSLFEDVIMRIIKLRKFMGLSQRQFSTLLGYSNAYISNVENRLTPFPQHMVPLIVHHLRLKGIAVTEDWLLSGKGSNPIYDKTLLSLQPSISEDSLTQFFLHALALSNLYPERRTLFVSGRDFEPSIYPGTFLIAPQFPLETYTSYWKETTGWKGHYLYEHEGITFPAKIERKQTGLFHIEGLHRHHRKVNLNDVTLTYLYPIIGILSFYALDVRTASSKKQDTANPLSPASQEPIETSLLIQEDA